jgi:hypothetical protein
MTRPVAWASIALSCALVAGCSSSNETPTEPQVSTPTPTPVPTPDPTPSIQACTLPNQPTNSPNCNRETAQFEAELVRAQDKVRAEQPILFTGDGRVISVDDYVAAVVVELQALGLCASQGGPRDEVGIKRSNDWNDQYDIVLGSGETWSNYTTTCRPARF